MKCLRTYFFSAICYSLLICGCNELPEEKALILPESLPKFEVMMGDESAFEGYIFLRKIINPGAQLMIDSKGDIQWFQVSDTTLFRPFTPYKDSYVALFSDKFIHEITYDGDTLHELKYGESEFDRLLHHEIVKDRQGNFVSLTREFLPTDLSGLGGETSDTIKTDGIIVLSRTGEKLWHWSLDQVLDPLAYEGILRMKKDWGHANALAVDDDGNYLVSWRDFNAIWKINSKTGELMWKVDHTTFTDSTEFFYKQHGVHKNTRNEVVLFDNGDRRSRGTSRAFSFRPGEPVEVNQIVELPDSLFTFKQGSVYEIPGNKWLFSSTMNKKIVLTDQEGNLLWVASSDHAFYRAYYLSSEFLAANVIKK